MERRLDYGLNYQPVEVDRFTRAYMEFGFEVSHILVSLKYAAFVATEADSHAKEAARHSSAMDSDPELWKHVQEEGLMAEKMFELFRPLLLDMVLCRCVDNFLAYLSDLMALVFRTRPQMLKAAEPGETPDAVPLDMVLGFQQLDDLIDAITERRVDQISHRGMRDLLRYWSKRLGFRLFERPEDANRAVQIVEIRNLIVHRRGKVSRIFLDRLPGFSAKLGERLSFTPPAIYSDIEFLAEAARDIDARAIKHSNPPHTDFTQAEQKATEPSQ